VQRPVPTQNTSRMFVVVITNYDKTKTIYCPMELQKNIGFFTAIFLIVFLCFFNEPSFAQTPLNLGTSPSSEKLQLQPGETHDGEIVVWNLSEETTLYNIYIRGFRQIENQPGTAIMFTEEEEARAPYSVSTLQHLG